MLYKNEKRFVCMSTCTVLLLYLKITFLYKPTMEAANKYERWLMY